MNPGSILLIILAAGRGSRMGANKALLDLGGYSALERVACAAAPFADLSNPIVVTGADHAKTAAEAARLGLRSVENAAFDLGQQKSLQVGLGAMSARTTHVIIHPVDLPLVTDRDYSLLRNALDAEPSDRPPAILVMSHAMRRGHPLLLPAAIAREILTLGPDETPRDLLKRHADRIVYVLTDNPWVSRDLDTPEDLEEARRALSG